jgi:hypothetical protein
MDDVLHALGGVTVEHVGPTPITCPPDRVAINLAPIDMKLSPRGARPPPGRPLAPIHTANAASAASASHSSRVKGEGSHPHIRSTPALTMTPRPCGAASSS